MDQVALQLLLNARGVIGAPLIEILSANPQRNHLIDVQIGTLPQIHDRVHVDRNVKVKNAIVGTQGVGEGWTQHQLWTSDVGGVKFPFHTT